MLDKMHVKCNTCDKIDCESRLDSRYDKNIQALHALLSIIVLLEFLVVAPSVVIGL